jgi:ABC-type proline/glycine betaine transport system ATPase subunit
MEGLEVVDPPPISRYVGIKNKKQRAGEGEASIQTPGGVSASAGTWLLTVTTTRLQDIRDDDVVIAVMGMTGSGKSTFISHFCRTARPDHGLRSGT